MVCDEKKHMQNTTISGVVPVPEGAHCVAKVRLPRVLSTEYTAGVLLKHR